MVNGDVPMFVQRPLKAIALASKDVYIPRGVAVPALDHKKEWEFTPKNFSEYPHALSYCISMRIGLEAKCDDLFNDSLCSVIGISVQSSSRKPWLVMLLAPLSGHLRP
jgi:hypothetical protein